MPEMKKAMIRRIIDEIWNRGHLEAIDALYAEGVLYQSPLRDAGTREELKELVSEYRIAFSDLRISIQDILVEGGATATRWTFEGTHTADLSDLPASGKKVVLGGVTLGRIEGGKVVEERVFYDALSMMQQLGVVAEDVMS